MPKTWIPLIALAVIVALLLCVGTRLWASGQAASITGPTHLKSDGNGRIYVGLADRLLVFSETGDFMERIPLSRFGVDELVGDFWVDGPEILLRAPLPEGSIARTLRVLLRIGDHGSDQAAGGQAVLQWCSLTNGSCRPFAPQFRSTRTFRLWKERASGAMLVADTAQHRLVRLQADGTIEAASPPSFKFPNALQVGQDGLLYVADTNHNRIVAVNPAADDFAGKKHDFRINTAESAPGKVWPTGLAQAQDGALWVINGNQNVAYGDLMIYKPDGSFRNKVDQPAGADPSALLAVKNLMLVADAAQFEIRTFDLGGRYLRPFGEKDLLQEMTELKNSKARFQAISTAAFLLLIGLSLAAVRLYLKAQRKGLV